MATSEEPLALLDRRVAVIGRSHPELKDAIEFHAQLLRERLRLAPSAQAQPFPVPREQLAARVRSGVPALHDQPARVDVQFAAALFRRLVNVFCKHQAAEVRSTVDAISRARLDPERLFGEAFVQHADHLAEIAVQSGVDAHLLTTLAAYAVGPCLQAYAGRLLPLIERLEDGSPDAVSWQRGYCPVCGGWPLIGEQLGGDPAQFLRCGACGSAWLQQPTGCPYCGTHDQRSRNILKVEGETGFRLCVCDHCTGYLKVVEACTPASPELLALDDIATRQLDALALEHGYRRPTGTGFSIELAVPEDEWVEEFA